MRGLPIGNLTSQLWANSYLDDLDHWISEAQRHGAYLRYTDDFLLFGDDKQRLWDLREGIVRQLASIRLRLAEPKSRLLATREGVPFCGFRFLPGLRPRVLGATKRRFETRRYRLFARASCLATGVRPSTAAATSADSSASDTSKPRSLSSVSAPGEGRTPPL